MPFIIESTLCCVCSVAHHDQLFANQWTVAHQAPLSMGFSRGFSRPWDQTHISCVSCIGRWVVITVPPKSTLCTVFYLILRNNVWISFFNIYIYILNIYIILNIKYIKYISNIYIKYKIFTFNLLNQFINLF